MTNDFIEQETRASAQTDVRMRGDHTVCTAESEASEGPTHPCSDLRLQPSTEQQTALCEPQATGHDSHGDLPQQHRGFH